MFNAKIRIYIKPSSVEVYYGKVSANIASKFCHVGTSEVPTHSSISFEQSPFNMQKHDIHQSVQRLKYMLNGRGIGIRFPATSNISVFLAASRLAVGPSQQAGQWMTGG
jgi:hypothetical protein